MSPGTKPNVTELIIPLKVKLNAIMRMAPGDPCPGKNCDGMIRDITLKWDMDGLDGSAFCVSCGEDWTLIQQPFTQDWPKKTDGD